jgi:hypothetical protein
MWMKKKKKKNYAKDSLDKLIEKISSPSKEWIFFLISIMQSNCKNIGGKNVNRVIVTGSQ